MSAAGEDELVVGIVGEVEKFELLTRVGIPRRRSGDKQGVVLDDLAVECGGSSSQGS